MLTETNCGDTLRHLAKFGGLLPTEWVNSGVFLQVEANFKGFLVNRMALSSQARCAHTSNW
jgi:hypothetical protein